MFYSYFKYLEKKGNNSFLSLVYKGTLLTLQTHDEKKKFFSDKNMSSPI